MDTKKWASVLVPRETYEELVAVAFIEGRTIGGQLRMMFEFWKSKNLTPNDLKVVQSQIRKNKAARDEAKKEELDAAAKEELDKIVI
jgi:hypothetical protein|tara:strand:- start:647 stop:907 length:261 start_codon:yes stop_codon:yes gene_type:complete